MIKASREDAPGSTGNAEAIRAEHVSPVARLGFIAAVAVAVIAIAAGPAYRVGVPLQIAFLGLVIGGVGGVIAAVLCLVGALHASPAKGRTGRNRALVGLLLSVIVAGFIWSLYETARSLPPIHDITTDMVNPPSFEAVLRHRPEGSNSPLYAGEEIARQQRAAYPDIKPIVVARTPDEVMPAIEKAARILGWEVVAADPAAGRLEATDSTLWFGFKDDVVVRLTPEGDSTVIDVRSASRVGVSDVGANAERIRRFFAVMDDLI